MHQAEEHPLRIDFLFGPKREAEQALVNFDVGKHRLHDPHPPGIDIPAMRRIDLLHHFFRKRIRPGNINDEKRPLLCAFPQTPML